MGASPAAPDVTSPDRPDGLPRMSEYQYYEFRAIDRPLDQKQMDELRRRMEEMKRQLEDELQAPRFDRFV